MSTQNGGPTETSPLLAKPFEDSPQPIEPSSGLVPDSTATNGAPVDPEHDGEDGLARQTSLEGRQKQYAGDPDVKKRMIYMFPALAIGVFLAAADQTIIVSSYGIIGSELDALQKTSWIATA